MFREVNSATSELFRFSREELVDISLWDLFASDQAKSSFKEQLDQLGVVENKEVEMFTRLKEKKSCILSVSREINQSGAWYVQGIIRDITHLKKIEKANLQIEKLQSADRLLRTLAHEVRNPLTNLYLSLDQLKPARSDQENMIYFDIFERNLRRIDLLISELLDSARPFEISLEKTTLQAIIDKTVAASADRISLKDISLQLVYPDQPAYIMADTGKLKIAFLNIVINAIEAVKPHSGRLTISVSDEGPHYKVSIEDNGTGISDENLSQIFDPYFTSKPNGFGLGLASALNIIRSHKASLDVQSTDGLGATFILLFEKA
jgi:PAS domain S-box-containing protein